MAWIVPPNTVIAEEEHPAIYLYSTSPSVQRAELLGLINKEELLKLRLEHHVACSELDQTEYSPYYKYKAPTESVEYPTRVFYTTTPLSADTEGGFKRTNLFHEKVGEILSAVRKEKPEALHKHFALAPSGSDYFYSFHGFYNSTTKDMFRYSLFLHGKDGKIVWGKSWSMGPEPPCDGCGIPTYEHSVDAVFFLMNVFSFEQFPFPVLLQDTSTIEGRAISFVTFDEHGTYSEYRLYEYVVNCILGR